MYSGLFYNVHIPAINRNFGKHKIKYPMIKGKHPPLAGEINTYAFNYTSSDQQKTWGSFNFFKACLFQVLMLP